MLKGSHWQIKLFFFVVIYAVYATRLPEEDMNATELIRNQGYGVENHKIVTEDGYILGVQRIPCDRTHGNGTTRSQKPKPAILLVHGLAASSVDWVSNLHNQSLAFILADAGYDVWLANVRGNIYSQKHVNLSAKQKKFWNFSWQEMAEYDIPAMVDYILNTTGNSQIYYVGHSQGTLIGFAKFSADLEFAKKIKVFFALAPVSTVGYIRSPVRCEPILFGKNLMNLLHDYSTGSMTWILDYIKPACDNEKIDKVICENLMMFLIGGEDIKHLNQTRIPVYIAHNPAGTSIKNIAHFGQNVMSKRMQMFDYGFVGNLKKYKWIRPPVYRVKNMKTFTVLFWSEKDVLADSKDISLLLPKIRQGQIYKIEDYSHIDFLFAINARKLVYDHILEILERF